MALIKCPECSKEISDKAVSCPNCGFPISENKNCVDKGNTQICDEPNYPYSICYNCGKYNPSGVFICRHCRHAYTADEYCVILPMSMKQRRTTVVSNLLQNSKVKGAIICPRCQSDNIEYLGQENIGGRSAKTKTVTSLNLNPLKPFTVFNHKEVVTKKGKSGINMEQWCCRDCGKIFNT